MAERTIDEPSRLEAVQILGQGRAGVRWGAETWDAAVDAALRGRASRRRAERPGGCGRPAGKVW